MWDAESKDRYLLRPTARIGEATRGHIKREGMAMRALDCVHPAHEDKHVTAETDEELVEKVREHITQAHPDMGPDQAQGIVAQGAYDEQLGSSPPARSTTEL